VAEAGGRTTALDLFRVENRRTNREALLVELHSCDDFPDGLFDDEQTEWLRRQIEAFDPQLVQMIEMRFEKTMDAGADWRGDGFVDRRD